MESGGLELGGEVEGIRVKGSGVLRLGSGVVAKYYLKSLVVDLKVSCSFLCCFQLPCSLV